MIPVINRIVVRYAPIEDTSDMSTVYTVMKKCSKMSHELGQSFTGQTMDQQLYCISKLMWHLSDEFNNHTMRYAGFHRQYCFISSIGQL